MSQLYRDEGIVLRTYKLGEADRIVVFCTRGRGKVRAVAKGVRKTKSKFGSRLEPMSHVALQLYEGRELDAAWRRDALKRIEQIRKSTFLIEAHMADGQPASGRDRSHRAKAQRVSVRHCSPACASRAGLAGE